MTSHTYDERPATINYLHVDVVDSHDNYVSKECVRNMTVATVQFSLYNILLSLQGQSDSFTPTGDFLILKVAMRMAASS